MTKEKKCFFDSLLAWWCAQICLQMEGIANANEREGTEKKKKKKKRLPKTVKHHTFFFYPPTAITEPFFVFFLNAFQISYHHTQKFLAPPSPIYLFIFGGFDFSIHYTKFTGQ